MVLRSRDVSIALTTAKRTIGKIIACDAGG
jgi:hypothetical protein